MVEQLLRERLAMFRDVSLKKIRSQQSHAAVNIKTHAARTDDGLGIVAVERRNSPNGEAVAAMEVRHPHATPDDARQRGHVRDLFYCWEEPSMSSGGALLFEFVKHEILQGRIDVEAALDLRRRISLKKRPMTRSPGDDA